MKLAIVAFCATLAPFVLAPSVAHAAPASAAASPVASPSSATATDVTARAAAFLAALRSQEIDRSLLTRTFSAELTPAIVATTASATAGLGEPTTIALRSKVVVDAVTTYDFTVGFASGQIVLVMGIDNATDKIARFYLTRA